MEIINPNRSRKGKYNGTIYLNKKIVKGDRKTIDDSTCLMCDKKFHIKPYAKTRGRGKYCSKKCYNKARSMWMSDKSYNPAYKVDFKLEKNPNWNGGTSFKQYPIGWNNTFKEQIRYRDEYKCQICGVHENECNCKLNVHHIDYNKDNLDLHNLISLCHSCHSKTNYNRDKWIKFFSNRVVMPNVCQC